MSGRILLSGTIAIDNIITPCEKAEGVLGGSACFAAVAAHLFCPDIDVLSVIGKDFPPHYRDSLEGHGIHLGAVTIRDGQSFSWTGEYFDNMNKRRTVDVTDEVMTGWEVIVPEAWANHPVVVASTMVPARQLELIRQSHSAKLVLSDSMDKWITRQPELLDAVIASSHVCTMNEDEAKIYAKSSSILDAGERLLQQGARYAVIKQGEYGSILFGRNGEGSVEMFRCPAWPLRRLIDPTGAGDSFLGMLGGYLSAIPGYSPDFAQMKEAVVHATVAASFTCESFSADALFSMTRETFDERLAGLKQLISLY